MRQIDIELGRADVRWGAALSFLQAGFLLEAPPGLSARAFMAEVLGFPAAYIEGSVSTVFLNDQPVDDIDAARVGEGSRLALSAAMPGLVGAVMRRRSPYASFREAISHHGDPSAGAAGAEGAAGSGAAAGPEVGAAPPPGSQALPAAARRAEVPVRVKLFNAVMVDRGPSVLARGIILEGRAAAEALELFGPAAAAAAADAAAPGPAAARAELLSLRLREAAP